MTEPDPALPRLARFFATSPAARRAVRPLAEGARVALSLDEGPAGFTLTAGAPHLAPGPLDDPDFTLRLPGAAVARLTARDGADVGELGVAFFQLLLERDPALRVEARVQAPTGRLVRHGYLAVLALGGLRVAAFLLARGLRDPRAIVARLRGR